MKSLHVIMNLHADILMKTSIYSADLKLYRHL